MEKNQNFVMEEKLGVLGILKESLKIPSRNPKFILLTILTSLPLVLFMVLHEIILQATMIETKRFLSPPPPPRHDSDGLFVVYYHFNLVSDLPKSSLQTAMELLQGVSPKVFQLGLLYFVPLHLLDLVNTITTVNSASAIYTKENPVNIKDMLLKLFEEKRFKGPLITSVLVLAMNSLVLVGLVWTVTNSIIPSMGIFFVIIYGIVSVALLLKWMEWSAIWNMGIVFSVLEERHGIEAFAMSGYFSKGNKRRGFYLMLIFFVWRSALRMSCLYMGGDEKWSGLAATSVLSCAGNVMKWVVCTVYFYDCKRRVLEKKVDAEEEKANVADMVSV